MPTTQTLYFYDKNRVYTHSMEQSVYDPIPPSCTLRSPPEVVAPKVAQWRGDMWITTARPAEAEEPGYIRAVPAVVTRRQARQALLLRGLLQLVQPAIDAIADELERGMAQIEWDDATEFERDRPLVRHIGQALGLDDAGLDDVFIFAASLP